MSFAGMQVLSLESRRAAEIAELIRKQGGEPVLAPSMREAPLERNEAAFQFAERLFAGEFDMMILLTGVGTRLLHQTLATRYPPERFRQALRRMTVVARGPKPAAVLRGLDVPVTVAVPEPNTWRELLAAIRDRPERRIAVQEYGRPNPDCSLDCGSAGRKSLPCASISGTCRKIPDLCVRRPGWPPANCRWRCSPLRFKSSTCCAWRRGGNRSGCDRGSARHGDRSIGPSTSEALEEAGVHPDLEPTHPKMGFLVEETAQRAEEILRAKRTAPR